MATSTASENQTLSMPMSIHTIPTNNDNQDIVSLGTNAALMTNRVVENTFQIQSILFTAIAQAVDYLDICIMLGKGTRYMYDKIRKMVPLFREDYPTLYKDIANLTSEIKNSAVQRYQQ